MSDLILPTPHKGKTRRDTVGYSTLYIIKMADEYIKQSDNTHDKLSGFLEFFSKTLTNKGRDIMLKEGSEIVFGEGDIYQFGKQSAKIAKAEALDKLIAIATFTKSLVAIFKNKTRDSNSLKSFIEFLPKYTNKL